MYDPDIIFEFSWRKLLKDEPWLWIVSFYGKKYEPLFALTVFSPCLEFVVNTVSRKLCMCPKVQSSLIDHDRVLVLSSSQLHKFLTYAVK